LESAADSRIDFFGSPNSLLRRPLTSTMRPTPASRGVLKCWPR